MTGVIVHDSAPVILVGGGKVKKSLLRAAIVHGSKVVAADGGVRAVLQEGLMPDAVIGDFDSISDGDRARVPAARVHHVAEQDSTDFEKCLARIEAPLVLGVGFLGGRLDHQLAVLHGLMRFAARPCLLIGARDIVFLAPPELRLDLPAGSRVSLFPMAEVAARSEGLRWPLEGLDFAPGRQIGTSNQATGPVRIVTDRPAMVIILPAERMPEAVAALSAPTAPRWPSR
ncbi:MAG: thiamine diphosphokinase [Paracoccaceae bacterium]